MHLGPDCEGDPSRLGHRVGCKTGAQEAAAHATPASTKASASWQVELYDPQTKRRHHIGYYASEEDAAGRTTVRLCRRSDQVPSATSRARPSTRCLRQLVRSRSSSITSASTQQQQSSLEQGRLVIRQTKRGQHIGCYASEQDAARAYDCSAVQANGPGSVARVTRSSQRVPPNLRLEKSVNGR
jgi:hypothetical protein